MLASSSVNTGSNQNARGLAVLADGVQAAFAAGVVAELARRGRRWDRGAGSGLGAHLALLALLGEAEEGERRWIREAALGCPLLESRLGAARRRLGGLRGVTVQADPWALPGWLDPAGLAEHLAPEGAGVPHRLSARGASLAVAVEDLRSGACTWVELTTVEPRRVGALLRAAAAFPGGWGPETDEEGERGAVLWGGASAALQGPAPWDAENGDWDVVCGFPVPGIARPALGRSLIEMLQRRGELEDVARLGARLEGAGSGRFAVHAPGAANYAAWCGRETADLGVEYPLPWERNAGLTGGLVRFGAFVAGHAPDRSTR